MFANALFLKLLNVGNSIIQIKNMAEVGTTDAVYDLSVSVQRTYVLTHTLRDIGHIPTAWVSILFVYLEGIRQPNSLNKQRLDTPLSFYAVGNNLL